MVTKTGGRPKQPIEETKAYGQVITQILQGNNRVVSISKALKKTHQAISQQMQELEKGKWVKRDKDGSYDINKTTFVNYTIKKFGTNRTKLNKIFDEGMALFSINETISPIETIALVLDILTKEM